MLMPLCFQLFVRARCWRHCASNWFCVRDVDATVFSNWLCVRASWSLLTVMDSNTCVRRDVDDPEVPVFISLLGE